LGLWVNGGGRDVNAVHYDAADSKSGTEKQQARINIGSTSATPQIIATSGAINDLVITSNNLVFTGSTVVLSGIVAGLYGEEITILNLTGGNITIVHASISLANNQFFMGSTLILGSNDVILLKYRSGAPGYWYLSSTNTFIRKNQGLAFVEVINSKFGINKGFVGGAGSLLIAPTTGSSRNIDIYNLSGVLTGWWDSGGSIFHTRSSSSAQSLRRDEQRLHYLNSITTIGSINDQALTDGIFNYRFTACTNLTGISNGEIGKRITIQNDSDSNLVMEHQDVLSLANNRLNLIGGASITIPTKGKMDIEYCTGNRWELVSKNF